MNLKFIKGVIYFALFFALGYAFGVLRENHGTGSFFTLVLIAFVVIFIFEWLFSLLMKRQERKQAVEQDTVEKADSHSEKSGQVEQTWDEMLEEMQKEFEKTWEITYQNHLIQVVNTYKKEQLFINDKLADEKIRAGAFSWLKTFQTLNGAFEESSQSFVVKVKVGGIFHLNCQIFVNEQLIMKEKIKYKITTSGVKKKD